MTILTLKDVPVAEIVKRAVTTLRRGGLLIYPTETVYGLGADATNQAAVDKLLKFKGQRGRKPILIAVRDERMAEKYVDLNQVARNLYRRFLPGPVAVVSRKKVKGKGKKAEILARGIASVEGTVGVRIPNYPLVREIIHQFGKPITTTSANISGARHPWSIEDIRQTTPQSRLEMVDLMLDTGRLPKRPPSTIIDTSREETEIVRHGEVEIRTKVKGKGKKAEIYISNSTEQTISIGSQLMKSLVSANSSFFLLPFSLVIALEGQLGAGKTVFVSGMARGLGITGPIRSPSYMLVREYPIPTGACVTRATCDTRATFFHIDAWRLHSPEEFADLGLEKMLRPGNVIAIEWAGRLAPIINMIEGKAKVVEVTIDLIDAQRRRIIIRTREHENMGTADNKAKHRSNVLMF